MGKFLCCRHRRIIFANIDLPFQSILIDLLRDLFGWRSLGLVVLHHRGRQQARLNIVHWQSVHTGALHALNALLDCLEARLVPISPGFQILHPLFDMRQRKRLCPQLNDTQSTITQIFIELYDCSNLA